MGVQVRLRTRTVTGGFGAVLDDLRQLQREIHRGAQRPDVVVVAVDANCLGFVERRNQIDERAGSLADLLVHAIADPHIERWLLLDGQAFKEVVGKGCGAPDRKCQKGRYKDLLFGAVRAAGVRPLLGGTEYAEDLARAIDLERAQQDPSLSRFIDDWRAALRRLSSGEESQGTSF